MIEYSFITKPTQADIVRLIELYRHAGWWTVETDNPALVAGIVEGSHCFLVGRQKGVVIAMGRAISDRVSDAYIQDITVDPYFRGQGIGSRIVQELIEKLEEDGIGWIGLIAERKTHPFYQALGFTPMADSMPMRKTS